MPNVTVYTTEACAYCRQAKALLAKRAIDYEEVDLGRDAEGRTELAARTGMMTFPQILIGGELVGGFAELSEADRSGRLAGLLAS